MQPFCLSWKSGPRWPQTYWDTTACTYQVLGLTACATSAQLYFYWEKVLCTCNTHQPHFLSLHSSQSLPHSFSPNLLSFHLLFRKEQTYKRQQPSRTKQNTTRKGKILHIVDGQPSPRGGKESQVQRKDSEIHSLTLLGLLQNIKLTALTYIQRTLYRPMQRLHA